ncbi:PTS transporter subunit IIC [Listeria monocytogenes]|uniref:PTS ascorbate transporter subunit IIC n=1 Tax=Listeria monocytogenes TaxID=1639 RepID=UPI000873F03D|nr:PTS ascorbate transporter subunit IIC [Listeria monocytogenes]EAC7064923.1 PTS sugar transporter subunit IIC [Listeria monocytogenes]EAD8396803.1 PTS sugar transporter subunit IIC [Listeria monocytogenes]EAD9198686.1 PTS sugar transporter subunit IIC [Listeria monocytogenes]EAE8923669.1 PTS sugar transporter subunit IIC [Listeria monocytogenes]EAF6294381.1 PTS sugar transporter subunit IIC [Listeria monocytogenes]
MLTFITEIFSTPAFILGIIAAIGLIALRKTGSDIVKGTLKTIFGFIMLQQGSAIIVGSLIPFSTMFENAFQLKGVVAEDNAIAAAVQQILGTETSLILVFGFIINVILARTTRWKYIFLTGHMMFSFAATMAIVFDQMGFNSWQIILFGSIAQGISSIVFPALAQPFVRKVTGNDQVGFGLWGSSLVWATGWLGGKLGNKANSTEDLKVPKKLDFLKEMSVLMGIVMAVIYIFTSFFVDEPVMKELAGTQSNVLFAILQAFTFVVGILILLQGVRMFLGELVPAFKGISEKIVPGAIPALDVPVFYSFAPTATTIGFLCAVVGGLGATLVSTMLPVVVLPSVIGLFFMGGAAGVFGNAMGGRRGAIIAGLLLGFIFQMIVAIAYPILGLDGYGIQGLWFASTDAIIVIVIIRLIGALFGIAL